MSDNDNGFFALDLETSPVEGDLSNGYALEPWRVRQGRAFISSISVTNGADFNVCINRPTREQLIDLLNKLRGKEVWAHYAVFDVAWCVASIEPSKIKKVPDCIMGIRWRDTKLAAKWLINGKRAEDLGFSYSLKNLIKQFFKDDPEAAKFFEMKNSVTMDPNDPYWTARAIEDTRWTLRLANFLWHKMPESQMRGFLIEQRSIPTIANSWLLGVRVLRDKLKECEEYYEGIVKQISSELGISRDAMSSSTQLGRILYNDWGLPVIKKTPTGKPAADADTIKMIEYQFKDPRLIRLGEAREALTILSKYVKTAYEALNHTKEDCFYGSPEMFGTKTGRFTYSSETLKKFKTSTAMHQIPRKAKKVRAYLAPPEGMMLAEADAAAQESRIMAIWSGDSNMINVFKNGLDFHSFTGAPIYGLSYQSVVDGKQRNDAKMIEVRQNGKLANLSCNFRIGGAALARKSFTEYGMWMSEDDGYKIVRSWKRMFPGIPRYWDAMVAFAKHNGYTRTIADRRWRCPKDAIDWKVEGTIISHPIQGTAAEQFYASTSQIRDARIITLLHDATFIAVDNEEEALEIDAKLNATPYSDLWNHELPIDLPYETNVGHTFADVK